MDLGLSNRIALVTGASSGIGAATARLFAQEGANVIACYHNNRQGVEETANTIRNLGRQAWVCNFDLGSPASIKNGIAMLKQEIGDRKIDAVVLCAGHNIVTPFDHLDAEEWNTVININLNGPFYLLSAVAPLLGDSAGVVTVASVAAQTGAPHHAHYAAAKAGLVNLTKSAARALAPKVRVNCVAPGITLTPMGRATSETLEPNYARSRLLLQRFAEPEEIARVIVFVASPAASFMTGATIDINGGRNLR